MAAATAPSRSRRTWHGSCVLSCWATRSACARRSPLATAPAPSASTARRRDVSRSASLRQPISGHVVCTLRSARKTLFFTPGQATSKGKPGSIFTKVDQILSLSCSEAPGSSSTASVVLAWPNTSLNVRLGGGGGEVPRSVASTSTWGLSFAGGSVLEGTPEPWLPVRWCAGVLEKGAWSMLTWPAETAAFASHIHEDPILCDARTTFNLPVSQRGRL
mmetsp:Transcript_3389/g.9641  ORF Transcript_3389/g.9641 Transcript_3389/m.9641 type:complete len:218 (+) Transcript_3389:1709-2362(+)